MKTTIKVKNVNNGMIFSSLNAAAKYYNTRIQVFSMLYRGKLKSYKGNTFEFEKVMEETIKVKCIETGKEWDSCYMASKYFHTSPSKFYQMYKNKKDEFDGLHFKFK